MSHAEANPVTTASASVSSSAHASASVSAPDTGTPAGSGSRSGTSLKSGLGLGLDVGGTRTRWALAHRGGAVFAEGQAPGFSGTQLFTPDGRAQVEAALCEVAVGVMQALQAEGAAAHGPSPLGVWAGVTGYDVHAGGELEQALGRALRSSGEGARGAPFGPALDPHTLVLDSDIALLARVCFAPGQGVVVVAGTGSVAVHLDAAGQLHRVGGRGGLLGDEGSGYAIAREALAAVWRAEDDTPGFIGTSVLAQELLDALGGRDWAATRRFVYGGTSRGAFGELALAVARAARRGDAQALALLERAGCELGRLATLLVRRHGVREVLVSGRVPLLHPAVEQALRAALPAGVHLVLRQVALHREAALRAAAAASAVP